MNHPPFQLFWIIFKDKSWHNDIHYFFSTNLLLFTRSKSSNIETMEVLPLQYFHIETLLKKSNVRVTTLIDEIKVSFFLKPINKILFNDSCTIYRMMKLIFITLTFSIQQCPFHISHLLNLPHTLLWEKTGTFSDTSLKHGLLWIFSCNILLQHENCIKYIFFVQVFTYSI